MSIINVGDNEHNIWKRKTKNKDRREQRCDVSYRESVRVKWFCCVFKFSPINM